MLVTAKLDGIKSKTNKEPLRSYDERQVEVFFQDGVKGPPGNPAIFPFVMLSTGAFLGGALFLVDAEGRLASLFSSPSTAVSLLTALGGVSITSAHGYSMAFQGNARKIVGVPHPLDSDDVSYLNAARGYYNMVEHMPFFLFNYLFARETSPCVAGAAAIAFGIGRVLYTKGYATEGPKGRITGFMVATFSSMACLGLGCVHAVASIL